MPWSKMRYPLSILDLATVSEHQTVRESLEATVDLAQGAEQAGYHRVWYAEHDNMASIASSATSVLIAHVVAHGPELRRAPSVLTRRTENSPRRDHDSQGPKRFCAHCRTLSKSALTAVKISREPHHQPQ